jgi:hypothetical protein
MKFMKGVTISEYFPHQGSRNFKSGNSFHEFHMPFALVQDPLFTNTYTTVWKPGQ